MIVRDNEDLAPFHTFGVHVRCKLLLTVESIEELREALKMYPFAKVLGGGSNILILEDLDEPVIRIALHGRTEWTRATDKERDVVIEIAAGENWHAFVTWCVENDLGGLENLALIPGTVGAAPMQNIGAYGIEQERCFVELKAMDRATGEIHRFDNTACRFGYRTSVFKEELFNRYIITSVAYRLTRPPHHVHATYKDVMQELSAVADPSIEDVYDAVVRIRTRKLPDPADMGNAGSFFKNPVVSRSVFDRISHDYDSVPHYELPNGDVKIPAAWLIDQCGWKGYRKDEVGVHDRQPLVLVNLGNAEGQDIFDLSDNILKSVHERFGISLDREVNVWK